MYNKKKYNVLHRLSEISISYKNRVKKKDRIKISNSTDVVSAIRNLYQDTLEHREQVYIVCLNRANEIVGVSLISSGGIHGTITDVRIIFQVALKLNSSSIILIHNHGSGNLQPSDADKKVTRKVSEAGTIMDIQLLDHIIITSESHFSFADNHLIL